MSWFGSKKVLDLKYFFVWKIGSDTLDISWLVQCWLYQSWTDQSWLALYTPFRQPSGYHPDTLWIESKHPQDTIRTPSRHTSDNPQTTTAWLSNIKHVGSFPLIETRCGFFFLPTFFFFLLVTGENKVNSYSNKLKLSLVCKLKWSLIKIKTSWGWAKVEENFPRLVGLGVVGSTGNKANSSWDLW